MSIRIKISRADLIAKMEVERKRIAADHAVTPAQVKAWQTKSLAQLEAAAKEVRAGRRPKLNYLDDKPVVSNGDHAAQHIDRAIRALKLCADDYLTVTDKSDYFRYI